MRYGIQVKVYPLGHGKDCKGNKEMSIVQPINHYE